MKSVPIRDLESCKNEAVWLKLTHPDPIYDENIDDESGGIRVRTAHHPITIGMFSIVLIPLLVLYHDYLFKRHKQTRTN